MITGFNTDIPFEGVTYHVQTEDKGLDSPLLLSLVYVGGAIIASKRTPYADLIASGFNEQVLTERLQRQHKLICAAIKAGRVEDLKRMGVPQGSASRVEHGSRKTSATSESIKGEGEKTDGAKSEVTKVEGLKVGVQRRKKSETAQPCVQSAPVVEAVVAATVVEEVIAAAVVEEGAGKAATTDSDFVIITTLSDEVFALEDFKARSKPALQTSHVPASSLIDEASPAKTEPVPAAPVVRETSQDSTDEIYLSLLDDEGEFRAGQLATIKVHVGRGTYGQRPVADASVTVKVLGTSFRPIIVTAVTDEAGVAVVRALLPRFTSGRAAIIIRAVSGEDDAEVRRIIHQS